MAVNWAASSCTAGRCHEAQQVASSTLAFPLRGALLGLLAEEPAFRSSVSMAACASLMCLGACASTQG